MAEIKERKKESSLILKHKLIALSQAPPIAFSFKCHHGETLIGF